MDKLTHQGSWSANSTLNWYPTDTQELYEKNLKNPEKKQQLEQFGWSDTGITYVNNSHGFRTSEFEPIEHFITIGCSFTYGVGLPQQCTWPVILSQHVGIPVYNLGMAGASTDTCYRVIKHYVPLLRPKFVVMLEPEPTRMEIFVKDQPYIYRPHWADMTQTHDPYEFGQDHWIKHWYSNTENFDTLAKKNLDAIAHVCRTHNADFYLYSNKCTIVGAGSFLTQIGLSLARDLGHPGITFNQRLAMLINQDLKNKKTYE